MRNELKNIFNPDKVTTSFGVVVGRVSSVKYKIEDSAGRTIYAGSTDYWPNGVQVKVQNGSIIGRATLAGKHRTYEV